MVQVIGRAVFVSIAVARPVRRLDDAQHHLETVLVGFLYVQLKQAEVLVKLSGAVGLQPFPGRLHLDPVDPQRLDLLQPVLPSIDIVIVMQLDAHAGRVESCLVKGYRSGIGAAGLGDDCRRRRRLGSIGRRLRILRTYNGAEILSACFRRWRAAVPGHGRGLLHAVDVCYRRFDIPWRSAAPRAQCSPKPRWSKRTKPGRATQGRVISAFDWPWPKAIRWKAVRRVVVGESAQVGVFLGQLVGIESAIAFDTLSKDILQ